MHELLGRDNGIEEPYWRPSVQFISNLPTVIAGLGFKTTLQYLLRLKKNLCYINRYFRKIMWTFYENSFNLGHRTLN